MKKVILLFTAMLVMVSTVMADEGMWLLPYLQKMNAKDMKAKGLKIKPTDIYNESGSALKDAIVIFGNGCTGEIVSADGLLFTNHHCGYGNIQALSSVKNDYLKNGFWAMNRNEELPAPGLSVKFIRHIEDITAEIVPASFDSETNRRKQINKNVEDITATLKAKYPDMIVLVRDFFGGNQYIAFAMEEYKDVRLVGAPPTSIGKFGADTDNWMWPRHTGDFSIFRVYADKDGRGAEYSKDNVPYKAPVHLKISLKGYKEGDFAMIMGFPGTTTRYMTSWEIDRTLDTDNPNRIFIRGVRQQILMEDMTASDKVRIQYAAKYAQSSNYWKNSIGKSRGLVNLNVKADKQNIEKLFTQWINASPERAKYLTALPLIEASVKELTPMQHVSQYLSETILRGTEIVAVASLSRFFKDKENPLEYVGVVDEKTLSTVRTSADKFYKDYNESTDKKVAYAMLRILKDSLTTEQKPSIFDQVINKYFNGDTDAYVDHLYENSIYANADKFDQFLNNYDAVVLAKDPAVVLQNSIYDKIKEMQPNTIAANSRYTEGKRLLVEGLMEMQPKKMHYPDANFTIRLTYGNILPYKPRDGVFYDYYTTLTGVMEKEDDNNPVEFTVDDKLKRLYESRDFGQYGYNNNVPVGFISNNDITGGNSGSPVLNGRGELIGLAFDGNWEAMSGDIAFEHKLQRCINVDVRYVLFIIDKYAGAGYLLNEMTLVR